jgi:hypothetical protein
MTRCCSSCSIRFRNCGCAWHEIDAARRAVAGDVVPARLQDAFPRRPDFRATQQGPGHSEDDDANVLRWLADHPRWMFHFTPASALWLNAVEGFFSAVTRRQIRRGAFHSSTICRPRSHATSTPTTAILDRSYGPLPPKQSPAAYRAEAVDHAVRQRDQIAALARPGGPQRDRR